MTRLKRMWNLFQAKQAMFLHDLQNSNNSSRGANHAWKYQRLATRQVPAANEDQDTHF